jgi:hypothetical protein
MDNNMNEILLALSGFGNKKMTEIGFTSFLILMGISLLSAYFIAFLYMRFFQARETGSQVYRSFPLLGISITAIFISIQFSLPLSLGLVGALSIVRFRTPIKEPEEIGFIMLVIAASLCCATFNMLFLGILLLTATVALVLLQMTRGVFKGRANDGMLVVRMPRETYLRRNGSIIEWLGRKIARGGVDSISDSEEQVLISYSFRKTRKEDLLSLYDELEKISPDANINVFFNRSGEI